MPPRRPADARDIRRRGPPGRPVGAAAERASATKGPDAAYGHDSFAELPIADDASGYAVAALDGAADMATFTNVGAASLTAADFEFVA